MRHGQAQNRAPSDEQRELTHMGQQQVMHNAQQHLANLTFDYVFVSPYVRAQQTWQLIQAQGAKAKTIKTVDCITHLSALRKWPQVYCGVCTNLSIQ